jgi:V/A-type H+-transporting ATPase subunit K
MEFFGQLGLALPLGMGALGSALGIGAAGRAAAGAWAKEAKAGKALNFSYIILTGMPLSQTIYGFILMLVGLSELVYKPEVLAANAGALLTIGLAGGLAELFSAWMQGVIGAAGCRALSEGEGKGLVFIIIAMGIVETVGLFGFVFLLLDGRPVRLRLPAARPAGLSAPPTRAARHGRMLRGGSPDPPRFAPLTNSAAGSPARRAMSPTAPQPRPGQPGHSRAVWSHFPSASAAS